jgi:hypothetical protein
MTSKCCALDRLIKSGSGSVWWYEWSGRIRELVDCWRGWCSEKRKWGCFGVGILSSRWVPVWCPFCTRALPKLWVKYPLHAARNNRSTVCSISLAYPFAPIKVPCARIRTPGGQYRGYRGCWKTLFLPLWCVCLWGFLNVALMRELLVYYDSLLCWQIMEVVFCWVWVYWFDL